MEASIWQAFASLTTPTTNSLTVFRMPWGKAEQWRGGSWLTTNVPNPEQSIIFILIDRGRAPIQHVGL